MQKVQFNFHTEMFRQTEQLAVARVRLQQTMPDRRLKILSFGSSIGEEIATLRFMFPDHDVYGCEIDDRLLDICRRSVGALATIFKSSVENIAAHGPFDLIVASAVLCLNPTPLNAVELFPVSRFDELVAMLDESLVPGGIFVITNAAYRFTESPVGKNYDTVRADIVSTAGHVDVFTRAATPYLTQITSTGSVVYQRHGDFVPRDDEDLADSVFEKRLPNAKPAIRELRLRPPPQGLTVITHHKRLNIDWAKRRVPDRCVVIEFDYQFCRLDRTGEFGYVQTISWTSLVGEGVHRRLPTWHLVP
ncbi:class I SAM-dependent methyltransferase [Rhizobium sp. KVB221]|uniref:Class I SAM-dependent methyltransferase n=1 Tax=Rhizobium setariae TaxID=2801340 RepID=A0A936YMJ0_9HYPH|nr:class I SAM-dependent methyltransferase [Rhizobium setariae]MBL0373153.1 class I SAM-dependent methyltransferase [Rhizobium setariae]